MEQQALIDKLNRDISVDPSQTIDAKTDLVMSGLVDSLGFMSLVDWIEAEQGVKIDATDIVIDHFESVEAIIDFVGSLAAAD